MVSYLICYVRHVLFLFITLVYQYIFHQITCNNFDGASYILLDFYRHALHSLFAVVFKRKTCVDMLSQNQKLYAAPFGFIIAFQCSLFPVVKSPFAVSWFCFDIFWILVKPTADKCFISNGCVALQQYLFTMKIIF